MFNLIPQKNKILIILVLIMGAVVINISSTDAFYNDEETSNNNSFIAGALDFGLSDSGFNPILTSVNFESGTTTSKTIGVALESDSNPIKYHASTTNITGDLLFCGTIDLEAQLANTSQFSGKLVDFISAATTTMADWQYDFSLPSNPSFYNSVCSFAFEYNGRQTAPHNEYTNGGYYDIETATSTISSWGFRINKVYYDVDSTHGLEGDNEWVEIYNQTDTALDITDWQICDNSSCDTLASSSPIMIPAKGFAVITAASTTWSYWNIPSDVVKIVLNSDIGNGLGNNGDRLMLKRPDGVVIDKMNWGTDTGVWNPAATDVAEGHMLGRKPNGYDTNQPSDFVDLVPPVLNLISPDQSGTLIWYWTHDYNIQWTATNPNGSDSDLKIDLSYIIDRDNTNTITPGDETVMIGNDLANTGTYHWTVPSGFLGYIWIKIVVRGPENPMLNSQMTSGKIYDPFPEEMWLNQREMIINSLRVAGLIASDYVPISLAEVEAIIAQASGQEVPDSDASVITDFDNTASSTPTSTDPVLADGEIENSTTTLPIIFANLPASPTLPVVEPEPVIEIPVSTEPEPFVVVPDPEEPVIEELEPTIESVPLVGSVDESTIVVTEPVPTEEPAIEPTTN